MPSYPLLLQYSRIYWCALVNMLETRPLQLLQVENVKMWRCETITLLSFVALFRHGAISVMTRSAL